MRFFAAIVAIALLSQLSFGSIVTIDDGYQFCYSTAGGQTIFEVPVGQTVDVDVYLYEYLANATFLLDDSDGLIAAGVQIMRTSASATEPAYVASVDDIAANPAFNEVLPYSPVPFVNGDISAGLTESLHYTATTGVQPVTIDSTTIGVYLGTFTFTGGSVVGEVTQMLITDNSDSVYDTATFDPEAAIDDLICSFAFDVVTVPEPATMSMLALGALALVRRRRA